MASPDPRSEPARPEPRRPAGRRRRLGVRALVAVASLLMALSLIAIYARHAAVDSEQFANRASAALRDDDVRALIADKVTDDVVLARQADLLAARPIIESAVSGIVGGGAFGGLFRTAVRDVHRAVFDRDQHTVTLTLADVGTVVAVGLQKVDPKLAREVRTARQVEILRRGDEPLGASLPGIAHAIRVLSIVFPLLCAGLIAAALWLAPDRRRTAGELGIGAAVAGVLVVVVLAIARAAVTHDVAGGADAQAAARAVWDAFLGDLRTAGWVLAACGAVVAAAAASLVRPVDLRAPARRLWQHVATEPVAPAARAARALGLVAAGVLVVVDRNAVVSLAVTALGVVLVYLGVNALLRLVYQPPDPAALVPEQPLPEAALPHRRAAAIWLSAGIVAVMLAVFLAGGGASTAAPKTSNCNGHAALCDRPLDKVAFAATHNAMSVPLPGWFSAEQERPIADQLADGIHALLIDTHYADRLDNGRLRTYFGSPQALRKTAAQDGVGPEAVDAALRIRERLGFSGKGTRGMYLCHTFCELGATTLSSVLRDIDAFLVTHPGEVLVVINQDYVDPADFVGAVRDAGLEDLVYRGPVSGDWPTLGEMIERNERIVFLAENKAGGAPWYHLAYEAATEETPFHFSQVAQLTDPARLDASCRPNRGPESAPLFLVNHWITTPPLPLPSDAAKVNTYDALLARVRRCEQDRDHFPNLIAVNFYRRGDVFRLVDTLNGVGGD